MLAPPVVQSLPEQVAVQLSPKHCWVQLPPAQENSQLSAVVGHCCWQLPPSQLKLQVESFSQFWAQFPSAHSKSQFPPSSQVQLPPAHVSSEQAVTETLRARTAANKIFMLYSLYWVSEKFARSEDELQTLNLNPPDDGKPLLQISGLPRLLRTNIEQTFR